MFKSKLMEVKMGCRTISCTEHPLVVKRLIWDRRMSDLPKWFNNAINSGEMSLSSDGKLSVICKSDIFPCDDYVVEAHTYDLVVIAPWGELFVCSQPCFNSQFCEVDTV